MTDLEIARDLRAAAEYLRTYGWTQHGLGGPGLPRCLVGGILGGTRHYDSDYSKGEPTQDVRPALGALGFEVNTTANRCDITSVIDAESWNDAPGRTAEEVIDRLESAALNLEIKALAASTESLAAERLELVGVSGGGA